MKIKLFGTLIAIGAVVAALSPSTAQANTLTNLTFEDIDGVGAPNADITGITVVEYDEFRGPLTSNGTGAGTLGNAWNPDSTSGSIPTNAYWSTPGGVQGSQDGGHRGLFWGRTNGTAPNWVANGGTQKRHRAEGNLSFGLSPLDNDGVNQVVVTVTGLDATHFYEFWIIANGRPGTAGPGTAITYEADFGTAIATTTHAGELYRTLHITGMGDNPAGNDLGHFGLPVGTTAGGDTSVSVSLQAPGGSYWIGVGYKDLGVVPEPTSISLLVVTGLIGVCALRRRKRCYVKA